MYRILFFLIFALMAAFFMRETPNVIVYENPAQETSIVVAESPTPPAPTETSGSPSPTTTHSTSSGQATPLPKEIRPPLGGRISETPVTPAQHQVIASPTPTPQSRISENVLYDKGLEATVNLICRQKDNEYSVATGAIIHNKGYIISNAHIADDLANPPHCTVGRSSPARKFGEARLVFLPKAYGESKTETERAHHDISIWKLEDASAIDKVWDIDFENAPKIGEYFLTQSYPAEFLADELFNADLNMLFSSTEIVGADEYLIEAKSSLASQRGSSGGILIDRYTGKVRGIIFGIDNISTHQINERKLYALTPKAINETMQKETGKTFTEYLEKQPDDL